MACPPRLTSWHRRLENASSSLGEKRLGSWFKLVDIPNASPMKDHSFGGSEAVQTLKQPPNPISRLGTENFLLGSFFFFPVASFCGPNQTMTLAVESGEIAI